MNYTIYPVRHIQGKNDIEKGFSMKSPITLFIFMAWFLTACSSNVANTVVVPTQTVVTPTQPIITPTQAVVVPTLQPYYLYTSDTMLIFLDFADGRAERASTTSQNNVYGQPCLMTYYSFMTTVRNGSKLSITALYVTHTPITINDDGTLTTNEVDNRSGMIIVENFKPSSIQEYNAQLVQLGRNTPHC